MSDLKPEARNSSSPIGDVRVPIGSAPLQLHEADATEGADDPPLEPPAVTAGSERVIKLWSPRDVGVISFLLGFPAGLGLAARNSFRLGRRRTAYAHLAVGAIGLLLLAVLPGQSTGLAALLNITIAIFLYRETRTTFRSLALSGRPIEPGGVLAGFATSLGAWALLLAPALAVGVALGSATSACPVSGAGTFPHQAVEIEATLPATVAGRALTRWSVRGRCWLELLVANPADIDPFAAQFKTASNPNPVDDERLVWGVAGRSDLSVDPPFFVYAAVRPEDGAEITMAMDLLFAGAGYRDIAGAGDLSKYQSQTIAGRQVYVGTTGMLDQDVHQRGRPYLYQSDQYMFVVITDDDAWAKDAIRQLP